MHSRYFAFAAFSAVFILPVHAQDSRPDVDDPEHAIALDDVVVTATPLQRGALEMTQATTVLNGEELQKAMEATIGETVERIPGVQSANFGAGVGRPIIRGLDGARVSVLENNVATNDVSNLSADHAVTVDPFLAEQVEVLKGPATLLYGTNGIGGIVNVRTNRVPTRLTNGLEARAQFELDTVADGRMGAVSLDHGGTEYGFHFDAFSNDREDYDIPGFAEIEPDEDEDEEPGTVENSFVDTQGAALGFSRLFDRGHAGIAYSRFESDYGIPGAGHHHEEEGEDHEDEDHDEEEEGEELVTLGVRQNKIDLSGELNGVSRQFSALRGFASFNDYAHTEFEGDEIGTQFDSDTFEGRMELTHLPVGGWDGVIGAQYYDRDFQAVGEEAFVPPSESSRFGLFLLEERHMGDWLLELGARIDDVELETATVKRDFSPFAVSAGFVWHANDVMHVAANLSRSDRAPVEEELFSNGPHIATQTFELGDADLDEETSTNLEVTLRRHSGPFTFSLTGYINDFDGFIFLADTGDIEDDLPVRQWSQQDAEFKGIEAEMRFAVSDQFDLYLMGDTVDAEFSDGSNLPRTPPSRFGGGLSYSAARFDFGVDVIRYASQSDVAAFETETDGYTLLDADLSFPLPGTVDWEFFLRGRNLTDEDARNHTSLLKESVPLPGRNFAAGIRIDF